MARKKILVIEDEPHLAEGLRLNLALMGHEVEIASDGEKALALWKKFQPDLLILDLMLPKVEGEKVLKIIRQVDERLPILILSAKNATTDRIHCLEEGVDDYLAKPFNLDELVLRVGRLLKKKKWYEENQSSEGQDKYRFGGNIIDFELCKAFTRAGEIQLTAQELKLMRLFIAHQDRPLSRGELLQAGWGLSEKTATRTVDNFIVRFRKYFEHGQQHFKNVRSHGYMFCPGDDAR